MMVGELASHISRRLVARCFASENAPPSLLNNTIPRTGRDANCRRTNRLMHAAFPRVECSRIKNTVGVMRRMSRLRAEFGQARVEAHGGAVAASRARLGVVGARAVPGEADQHGAVGAVVVTLRVEDSRDGAPDGVVVSRGRGGRGGGRRDPAEQVVEEAVLLGVPEAGAAGDDEEGPGLLLLVLFGGGGRGEREGVRKKCQKKRGSRGRKEGRVVRGNHHRR